MIGRLGRRHFSIARTYAEAYSKRKTATELLLSGSPELLCMNIMCAQVAKGCACRLAMVIERMPQLQTVDISFGKLPVLPDSLYQLKEIQKLYANDNLLASLSVESTRNWERLEELHLQNNHLTLSAQDMESLLSLPSLKVVNLKGNNLSEDALAALNERVRAKSLVSDLSSSD